MTRQNAIREVASARVERVASARANEALQLTKPAFTSLEAVFAAERRCSADCEALQGKSW